MPTPLRNVALTAMEVATVARMFPGRFLPGVGHGVQGWMGRVGGRVSSPLTLLEEYAVALRRLLDGEEVTVTGQYVRLERVRLAWPPVERVPLLIGGTGPRTLELAGRLGDAVLLGTGVDLAGIVRAGETAGRGWAATHPDACAPPLVDTVIAATGPDASRRIAEELPKWGAVLAPGVAAAGSADAIADVIRASAEAGATSVTIQPTQDEPDLEGFIAFLGEEVRPLIA